MTWSFQFPTSLRLWQAAIWFVDLFDWRTSSSKKQRLHRAMNSLSLCHGLFSFVRCANLCIMRFWYLKWFRFATFFAAASSRIKNATFNHRRLFKGALIMGRASTRSMRICRMQHKIITSQNGMLNRFTKNVLQRKTSLDTNKNVNCERTWQSTHQHRISRWRLTDCDFSARTFMDNLRTHLGSHGRLLSQLIHSV